MEYYGEKPKKFTKEWWPYFWDYYKWHTIVIVFIIVSIIATVYDVMTQEKFDASLVTAGNVYIGEENSFKLEEKIEKNIDDIDENGAKAVLIEQLMINDEDENIEYASAMRTKFELKLQTDESFAFIMDKAQLELVLSSDSTVSCFAELGEWLGEDVSEDCIYEMNGKKYAVELKHSKCLKELGLNGEGLYAVLRYNYKPDKPKLEAEFENAQKILNYLCIE